MGERPLLFRGYTMILYESDIEETALDLLKALNGYQVVYGSELADGVYDAHCPAVRAGQIRTESVGAGSVRAGSEPAPTAVIYDYPEPAPVAAIHNYPEPTPTETH